VQPLLVVTDTERDQVVLIIAPLLRPENDVVLVQAAARGASGHPAAPAVALEDPIAPLPLRVVRVVPGVAQRADEEKEALPVVEPRPGGGATRAQALSQSAATSRGAQKAIRRQDCRPIDATTDLAGPDRGADVCRCVSPGRSGADVCRHAGSAGARPTSPGEGSTGGSGDAPTCAAPAPSTSHTMTASSRRRTVTLTRVAYPATLGGRRDDAHQEARLAPGDDSAAVGVGHKGQTTQPPIERHQIPGAAG